MNRSILIVICDFLLVSLLAFSTVDINKISTASTPQTLKLNLATNRVDSSKDLAAVMRLALDEERKGRDKLMGELTNARAAMSERERQVQSFQQELKSREQETSRLQLEQTNLHEQFASAQASISALNQRLQSSAAETVLSKEKIAEMEAETRKQTEQAAALQRQLAELGRSNQVAQAERQRLASQLQVAEAEKRAASDHAARMQEEVKIEREEKAKLAEGVKQLASRSGELTQEIRENRALAPNTIFNDFVTNRVQAHFSAVRPGLFGAVTRNKETETVLSTDGTNIFALCHVQDTPLALFDPGTDWDGITGTLVRENTVSPIPSLSFLWQDPRIVFMPITKNEARQLGCSVYRIASDPYKFQDAVLIGSRAEYYGECKFQIDLSAPEYFKMDHNSLKGLFGKFNPSRGDLVFSKSGELIGVMANSTYCLRIHGFEAVATFQFAPDVRAQHTAETLSRLYGFVSQLPSKLQ